MAVHASPSSRRPLHVCPLHVAQDAAKVPQSDQWTPAPCGLYASAAYMIITPHHFDTSKLFLPLLGQQDRNTQETVLCPKNSLCIQPRCLLARSIDNSLPSTTIATLLQRERGNGMLYRRICKESMHLKQATALHIKTHLT